MKLVLVALVAALSLTAARAARAASASDKVVSSIVVSAALGEKDRLAQVEAIVRTLRPGVSLAPVDHAALWAFQMRWSGTGLHVMGADEAVDADRVVELLASTQAPSPAYRKILLATARVTVQSSILLTIADTAQQLGAVLAVQTAAVQQHDRTVNELRDAAQAIKEKLQAKGAALEVIMAAVKDPAMSPDRRERLRTELVDGKNELDALAARLDAARSALNEAAQRLDEATSSLEAAMHQVPLGPVERAFVARRDLELQGLRAIAQRLDAKPQLRPDQIMVFPSGLR